MPGLSLRISQHLALTPQLQQSIRLLQLSTLELQQEVEQMLVDNPFLEAETDSTGEEAYGLTRSDAEPQADEPTQAEEWLSDTTEATESASMQDWEGDGSVEMSLEDSEWGGEAPASKTSPGDEEIADAAELSHQQESLQEFLARQALALRLDEEDRAALTFLIGSLDEDGYLSEPLEELALSLAGEDDQAREELQHRFVVALGLLQSLEPVGVGARNLAECLILQLKAMVATETRAQALRDLACCLCSQPMEQLARRDARRLALACESSEELVRQALALIARLEPKPGRRFVSVERNIIVPDVLVQRRGNGPQTRFRVQINPEVMPRLRVHEIYAQALKGHKSKEGQSAANSGLHQRLQEARWFIKNLQQRFDTILRVSQAIVERQRNFFLHGELAMRPLVLREIAEELSLHESTISRVTTAKYMSTPFGTFELKYFFGSGLGTEAGGSASSTAVRALIRQFIAAENPGKPLSDNQLSAMLKEQGIECARRTVAKYREALKIAPANLRGSL